MAGVFLSYDRDDSDRARHFARELEKAGHNVWWDLHVRGGAQFGKVIEEALKAADAVVVLWSKHAVESAWVKDEAAAGRDSGRLVPVTIDGTEPPLGFRQFQTIDLSRWKGRGSPPALRTLLGDIDALGGSRDPARSTEAPHAPAPSSRSANPKRWIVGGLAAVCAIVLGIGAYWFMGSGRTSTTIAVTAADGDPLSRQMARDLLVKLGGLQASAAGDISLVDESGAKDADLKLAISGAQRAGLLHAGVALTAVTDNGILWSTEAEQPLNQRSQTEEAMAFAAARVLQCAIEEVSGDYGRLSRELRRTYLNACVALGEVGWDNRAVLPQLRQVTSEAPRFRPAWAKLVTAQADYVSLIESNGNGLPGPETRAALAALRQYVDDARKVDPDMAEATLAELTLNADMPVEQMIATVDKAKAQDPHNAGVLSARAGLMQRVGRMAEAVDDADQAARLDPLSPYVRAEFIRTLLYAGAIDRARSELSKAKQLWPDADTIREAEFSIELRVGDFEKAVRAQGFVGPGFDVYARAIRDPTDANVNAFLAYVERDEQDFDRLGYALQGFGQMNRPNEFFELVGRMSASQYDALSRDSYILFRPWMASIRRDPRFMHLTALLRLNRYWRSSDIWPDFCRGSDLHYDCKKEAAKYG